MLGLDAVSVRFGTRVVLDRVSLRARPGRTLAILGPNGRGKTTALRCLIGLARPDDGRAFAPRVVGYVPQTIGFAHPYRVVDVVVMGRAAHIGLFGRPGAVDGAAAEAALDRVGVARLAAQRFDRLSGGERQLVLLARALATGSAAIVLDEPTAALDLANEQRLLGLLAEIRAAREHAVVFTTHDPNHALAVADDVALMMPDGEVRCGPVATTMGEADLARLYGVDLRFVDLALEASAPATRRRIVVPTFLGAAAGDPCRRGVSP